ncbi:MAG: hypothetical protein HY701_03525 [Gemmatimonadetes bacterium]|nr:hypothetical protein [Gemmatimonadota bacterium]
MIQPHLGSLTPRKRPFARGPQAARSAPERSRPDRVQRRPSAAALAGTLILGPFLLSGGPGGTLGPLESPAGAAAALAATPQGVDPQLPLHNDAFKTYWFSGQAELNRYRLEQVRYGEVHEGDAVLIFVTEDFLPDKQVKDESSDRTRTGSWPILKLNLYRQFVTGIYPYTMMTSVFSPLDVAAHPHALKTSTAVQEWCGNVYLQMNLRNQRYDAILHSYFEDEADQRVSLDATWLEDEIWTRIRMAPFTLPQGDLRMIPGGQESRLRHSPLRVERARASLERHSDGSASYVVQYPDAARTLTIRFGQAFPHEILGWEESFAPTGGAAAPTLTTRATRTHVLKTDYWARHGNADRVLRAQLGLP